MARALWKGAISFGLVTIPVALYPAKTSAGSLSFHMLDKRDLKRVRNKRVDDGDHEVPYDDVVRGYEYEKDQYVVIGDEDLKAANVEATQSIDIMHFVDLSEIDLAYFETPYYTEPMKAGRKAYALLRETLERTGKVGVAKIVIRERQHLCALMADGPILIAEILRWPYELRSAEDFNLPGKDLDELGISPQEVHMAQQLVEAMVVKWDPKQYHDTYREDLLKLIDEKVKSGELTHVREAPAAEPASGEVVDIMSLLKRSMQQRGGAGETAASEGAAESARGRRATTEEQGPRKKQRARKSA
jgi:DNA end-binding protein Ku